MEILANSKELWGAFGIWASIVGPIFGLFLFVHRENAALSDSLDKTNNRMDQTNKRIDDHFIEINKRSDQLHQEFIDLLKELKK